MDVVAAVEFDNEMCIVATLKSSDGINSRNMAILGHFDLFLRLSEAAVAVVAD